MRFALEWSRSLSNGGKYSYQYNLSDHLGNARYSFDIYGEVVRPLQQGDYYALEKAFCLRRRHRYLYNGKEYQDELWQHDYGAGFYDLEIGRWNVSKSYGRDVSEHIK